MNKVELLFQGKGLYINSIYVYPKNVAIDFVKECKNQNIGILGIDAFLVKTNFHQPSMDNSIDLTRSTDKENSRNDVWDTAISFLRNRDDIYKFEIICDDLIDYKREFNNAKRLALLLKIKKMFIRFFGIK